MSTLFSEKNAEASEKNAEANAANADTDIPSKFLCGLSGKVMQRPVRIFQSPNRTAYDAEELEAYFEDNGREDPETGRPINADDVMIDAALQVEIQTFIRNNPQLWHKIPMHQSRK
ncbi:MAG TPA: U-box domain-containing protein [Gammaproteobacteria bacterium]|jgi:hypothetical protein|nr:U-box domain-containing protein [Gammaproteobacteria bacterium]